MYSRKTNIQPCFKCILSFSSQAPVFFMSLWGMRKYELQCCQEKATWTCIPPSGNLCDVFNTHVCLGLLHMSSLHVIWRQWTPPPSTPHPSLCPSTCVRKEGRGRKLKAQLFQCLPFVPSGQIFIYVALSGSECGGITLLNAQPNGQQ